jgi:hypothetical protein
MVNEAFGFIDNNSSDVRGQIKKLVSSLSQDDLYKIYEMGECPFELTDEEHLLILDNICDKSLIEVVEGELNDRKETSPERIFVQAIVNRLKQKCGLQR